MRGLGAYRKFSFKTLKVLNWYISKNDIPFAIIPSKKYPQNMDNSEIMDIL